MKWNRRLHLTNAKGRNATVLFGRGRKKTELVQGVDKDGEWAEVDFLRFLAANESGLHDALVAQFGADYGNELMKGDPEIDLELVGRRVRSARVVYLSNKGELMHAPPKFIEVVTEPDGEEKERREPRDVDANVNNELPLRWTGRKFSRDDIIRKFAFGRALQLRHSDGVTYDFLFDMAKELDGENMMMRLGAGENGKEAMILQSNGIPYHAFVEGRVDGERYKLFVHMASMELKRLPPKTDNAPKGDKSKEEAK